LEITPGQMIRSYSAAHPRAGGEVARSPSGRMDR
jgi:hypothetical protein